MFDKDTLKLIYYAHIQSHIVYGLNVWGGMVAKEVLNKLQKDSELLPNLDTTSTA